MAANGARKTLLQFSSASAKTLVNRSTIATGITSPITSKTPKLSGIFSSKSTSASASSLHRLGFSRLPTVLGGALSLMPLHNVTASALFTSLLTLHGENWGCLSEGFATPL